MWTYLWLGLALSSVTGEVSALAGIKFGDNFNQDCQNEIAIARTEVKLKQ